MLIITITLMGASSTLIGVLPVAKSVGAWAAVLLIILRILQGLGAGAEQAGSTTLMAEYSPVRRRGYFSSLPFVGIMFGTLLASIVFWLVSLAPNDVLVGWLWRIPFLVSIILIGVAIFIRMRLQESPEFIKLEEQAEVEQLSLARSFTSSWRAILAGIGLRMAENGGSYIYQTLAVSYVTSSIAQAVSKGVGSLAVGAGAIVGLVTIPLMGHLSDRYGRMPIYRIGAAFLVVFAFPSFWLLSLGNPVLTIVVIGCAIGLGVNVMLGAQCAALPELFGNSSRYLGVAMAREISAILAGGIAPFIGAGLLLAFSNSWVPLAIYMSVLALITFATTFVTPETRARNLSLLHDAYRDTPDEIAARPLPLGADDSFAGTTGAITTK